MDDMSGGIAADVFDGIRRPLQKFFLRQFIGFFFGTRQKFCQTGEIARETGLFDVWKDKTRGTDAYPKNFSFS